MLFIEFLQKQSLKKSKKSYLGQNIREKSERTDQGFIHSFALERKKEKEQQSLALAETY